MMEPTIKVIAEAWPWQVFKIRKAMKELNGFLGKYNYRFFDKKQNKADILLIKIKPLYWKKTLRHEMIHHEITRSSKSFYEAKKRNKEFDEDTHDGKLFWKENAWRKKAEEWLKSKQ